MDRKEFFAKVGFGAALLLVPSCIGGLTSSCSSDGNASNGPSNVDFTVDISTGALVNNGGYMVQNDWNIFGRFISLYARGNNCKL
jgi:cytochrome b6-f complex iron-sulfur subunit